MHVKSVADNSKNLFSRKTLLFREIFCLSLSIWKAMMHLNSAPCMWHLKKWCTSNQNGALAMNCRFFSFQSLNYKSKPNLRILPCDLQMQYFQGGFLGIFAIYI